jgi:hypothetical protein
LQEDQARTRKVGVDWIGPLIPPSREGFIYILTVVDYWTGFPWAFPSKTKNTQQFVKLLINNILPFTQYPKRIVSDRDKAFAGTISSTKQWEK